MFYPLWHDERDNNQNRRERYDEYKRMRSSVGKYTFRKVTGQPGFRTLTGLARVDYDAPTWPVNFFRNQYISLAFCLSNSWDTRSSGNRNKSDNRLISPKAVRIESSTPEGVLTLEDRLDMSAEAQFVGMPTRCIIWSWETALMAQCWEPNILTRYTVRGLEPGKYYLPVVNGLEGDNGRELGFAPMDRIWRDDRERIDDRRQWYYGGEDDDAVYERASQGMGAMDVYIKSGDNVRMNNHTHLVGLIFVRPEVMELINVSPNPISLKNWTLTFNTGTIANDIGQIESCYGYSPRGGQVMSNPLIEGNGYMYLVNDVRLFNSEFGSGTPTEWGRNASQQIPVWEIPRDSWGVQYEISGYQTDTSPYSQWIKVFTRNERFKENQFAGEVLELRDTRSPDGRKDAGHGTRYGVAENGPNWFQINAWTIGWQRDRFNPSTGCDTMMLVGMPAKGGVVSMTLKNEYKQITSRTVEYDYLDQEPRDWYGRSVEKLDPTHYNWRVVQQPSISGRPRSARNRSMKGSEALDVVIKNGPYNSVAELQQVRSSRDFENIGGGRAGGESERTMSALASAFANSSIRLEAGDEECERTGWRVAAGRVQSSGPGNVTVAGGRWESDQWEGQTLRFLTGSLRGESFPIAGNTRVSLDLSDADAGGRERVPYSAPSRKSLMPSRGDIFTIGPGFASPLCYTRRSNEAGTWTWRNRVPVPGAYDLYIFGLSDSINTTEFLEENDNASLDVLVWNYRTGEFDTLCQRKQYGKEDSFNAGRISADHVSAVGDFRLQLVSHDVTEDDQTDQPGMTAVGRQRTGFCWFNYAVLAPVPVFGRVNVNTASVRVLRSLPGIDAQLATAIARGIDSSGRPTLKPYRQLGDLLKVKGMDLAAFERFVNLVMLESYTYTVAVEAQSFDRTGLDGDEIGQEDVASQQNMRYIIELVQGDDGAFGTRLLEQTRL
jgi:hypothetical protein